ncbi:hypothetical protein ENINMM134B_08935 [Enterobacter intestinihominis]|nr:hypothetical protein SK63_00799 [Enterobacter sp. BIDMC110]
MVILKAIPDIFADSNLMGEFQIKSVTVPDPRLLLFR